MIHKGHITEVDLIVEYSKAITHFRIGFKHIVYYTKLYICSCLKKFENNLNRKLNKGVNDEC